MDDGPKVSIVLPCYNGARLLRRSVESCLRQTYRNLELILVDDRSTDPTYELMRSFADPRVRVLRNARNLRLPRSLNEGFRAATGEVLTWTSDDNEYLPGAIASMLETMRSSGADLVYADYWAVFEDTGTEELRTLPDRLDLGRRNDVGACFLYTRRVYEAVGDYDPDFEIVEDYDYWMRITARFRAARCPKALYRYLYHSRSLTTASAYHQWFWDRVLKYHRGHLPYRQAAPAVREFFRQAVRMKRTRAEKIAFCRRTFGRLFRISPGLGAAVAWMTATASGPSASAVPVQQEA